MAPLSPSEVLAAEYREASQVCPPVRRESPASAVTAPVGVTGRRGTPPKPRNRLVWLQIQLFLENLPKRPGSPA